MSRFVYQGTLQDGNGKRLADGNVAVLLAGTSTPASIYAASTGGVAVASVTTEDDGSWSFYIDEADYAGTQRFDVVRSKSGYLSLTTEDIEVLPASAHVGLSIKDTTDRTKIATLSAAGITTATTRTLTLPDADDTLVGKATTDTLTNKTTTNLVQNGTATGTAIKDEDDMASDSATHLATQQSIKAYVTTSTALAYRGAYVNLTSAQSINDSSATAISFNNEVYDTDSLWSGGAPTRITVPAGVSKISILAVLIFKSNATGIRQGTIFKNGAVLAPTTMAIRAAISGQNTDVTKNTGVIEVTPGDYFEVFATQTSGGALDIYGATNAVSFLNVTIWE